MMNPDEIKKMVSSSRARDHMANERTFLAWIRTSIGIMAFGFVVEKFALFIKEIGFFMDKTQAVSQPPVQGFSSIFGMILVVLGTLICLFAFMKYKSVEKQIEDETYQPSMLLNIILTLSVLLTGMFLVTYLSGRV